MEETGHWWSSGARTLCPDVRCFTLMGHGVYGMAAWRHLGHALEMTRGVASGISKAQAEGERYPVKLRSWPEMPPGPARDPGQEWAGSLEMVQGVSVHEAGLWKAWVAGWETAPSSLEKQQQLMISGNNVLKVKCDFQNKKTGSS